MNSTASPTRKIVLTAIILAITLVFQITFQSIVGGIPFWGQIIVGSLVNLGLYIAIIAVGLGGGITVSAIVPLIAGLLGKTPLPLAPLVMASNIVLVVIFWLLYRLMSRFKLHIAGVHFIGVVVASLAKWLFCQFIMVEAIKFFAGDMQLSSVQINVLTFNFSWPQLITACIGGVLAYVLYVGLSRAKVIGKDNQQALPTNTNQQ